MTTTFDVNRATLHKNNSFDPFYVQQTTHLEQALANGLVNADTDILLLDHPQQPIALLKTQMHYHHVAQGNIAGEPWMVTF